MGQQLKWHSTARFPNELSAVGEFCDYWILDCGNGTWECEASDCALIEGSLQECLAACDRHEALIKAAGQAGAELRAKVVAEMVAAGELKSTTAGPQEAECPDCGGDFDEWSCE